MNSHLSRAFFALILSAVLTGTVFAQLRADLVIVRANIRTMDARRTVARSMAVLNGRIVAIETKVVNARGKTVLPGFNDAHLHFTATGAQRSQIDLGKGVTSAAEFVRRLKEYASKLPKGRWITGGRWDHENWTPVELPTAAMIDAATPYNPVYVNRLDGHMSVANSLAMRLAGVDKNTKDVAGGEIVRDAAGNPTGIFKDAAETYIESVIPEASFEQKVEEAIAATEYAASLGITSAQDMGSSAIDIAAYQELIRQGKLKTRLYGCTTLAEYERWHDVGVNYAFGTPWFRVGCLKAYADGSLGSTTAWLFEPYSDAPNTSGLARADVLTTMKQNIVDADKARLQVNIHAIGDRANATVLDYYSGLDAANGARDRRFRIEHAQHLRPGDIPRFGKHKVIASMQPMHVYDDGKWAGKRIGRERLRGTYAFRTLLDTGAVLAFGSDSPVANLSALFGIYAAVTRQTSDLAHPDGWIPEQKITVDEAVRAFTHGSAYAEFQELEKGTLEVGKLADFVVLSDDIFTIAPAKIRDARVVMTVVDGKVAFEAK
jgi:predicted amidohydrolase YtcJ